MRIAGERATKQMALFQQPSDIMKILVGMSGGVDSSVAALVLKEQGHEVIGVSMRLFSCNRVGSRSCCTERDRADARAVCEQLGIPYHIVDMTERFTTQVVEPFLDAYLRGETPSPCIACNEYLKFDALYATATSLGAGAVATGHYARIMRNAAGRMMLMRGVDQAKDQSYFVFPALRRDLSRLMFPLGGFTKSEVRARAKEEQLPVHDKDESQEICFVPDDDYVAYIEEMRAAQLPGKGNFVDRAGTVLGTHRGIHAYTIGQRRGLGRGFGARRYVVCIDAARNEVVLGDDDELLARKMTVREVVWAQDHAVPMRAQVQVRSTARAAAAVLEMKDDCVRVVFDEPQRAIAPGQAAVFYEGEEVIGGGWITT